METVEYILEEMRSGILPLNLDTTRGVFDWKKYIRNLADWLDGAIGIRCDECRARKQFKSDSDMKE